MGSIDLTRSPFPAAERSGDDLIRRRLPNGIEVVGAPMPTPSVCFALYLTYGSLHEPVHLNGITHLMEHLLFKGSTRHSEQELADAAAAMGAESNAFTWWLGICTHSRVLRRHAARCLALVAEHMTRPRFTAAALEAELPVVLQEMARSAGVPMIAAMQALMAASYPGHPLGRPIIGTEETLRGISVADLAEYHAQIFRPDRLVLVVAGDFDLDEVLATAGEELGDLAPGAAPLPPPPLPPPVQPRTLVHRTDAFQNVHLAYWFRVGSYGEADYYPSQVLATLLGDETRTGSRLLRGVQQAGLAHEVFSTYQGFDDHGMLCTFASTTPELAAAADRAIRDEFAALVDIDEDEVRRASRKVISRIAVDGETSQKRALALARLYTGTGRLTGLHQLAGRFREVTAADLRRLVATARPAEHSVRVALGPVPESLIPESLVDT